MKTCEHDGVPFTEARSHPWTDGVSNPDHRYYDLKAEPSRIRSSLEDFVPWAHYAAIGDIYSLLEWLNAPSSTLESNDSAFSGAHANEVAAYTKPLQCSGRIMVLYRDLERNLSRDTIAQLALALHHGLGPCDPEFEWGMVGTTIVPVRYRTLAARRRGRNPPIGYQLMISFWSWGSSEAELMTNLARLVSNLSVALRPFATG